MSIHLRQICLVANDLRAAVSQLTTVLGIHNCHEDDGVGQWGLANVLMPVGTDFLEVVAPIQTDTAAGRYLDRRGGDGGYMVITQADSAQTQAACKARAAENQVRVAFERDRPDYHLMQLHPADMVASFLEIDSAPTSDFSGDWHPAGGTGWQQHVDQTRTVGFSHVQLQSEDPDSLAQLWSKVLDNPVAAVDGHPAVELANASLQFVPVSDGRGPGLGAIGITVKDRDAVLRAARDCDAYISDDVVTLCGTRFNLESA